MPWSNPMNAIHTSSQDLTETTEEIAASALELMLCCVLNRTGELTSEQRKREGELHARCVEWFDRGYIVTGERS